MTNPTPPGASAAPDSLADTSSNAIADSLLTPLAAGELRAATRVWMAPLTRSRSHQPGDIPWELNAEYYAQRADPGTGAGVIVSEATQVSPQGKGYAFTPGVHSAEQVAGWRRVTEAVHRRGGLILCQLWHVGRISHTALQPAGQPPVAPSAIRAQSQTYIDAHSGRVDVSQPRALETDEIPGVVEQFRTAAANARDAGFDGVEIHGANGYLLDQFLRTRTNKRTDAYGGSLENRARFCLEVARAVLEVWPAGRVGYRVSPLGGFNDVDDDDPRRTFAHLAGELGALGLAYIHVVEQFGQAARTPQTEPVFDAIRSAFKDAGGSAYLANGGYTPRSGGERIAAGLADAIAFGKLFISNPDLAGRIRRRAPLADWDQSTFYGGDARGYTDYPPLTEA